MTKFASPHCTLSLAYVYKVKYALALSVCGGSETINRFIDFSMDLEACLCGDWVPAYSRSWAQRVSVKLFREFIIYSRLHLGSIDILVKKLYVWSLYCLAGGSGIVWSCVFEVVKEFAGVV